MTTYLIGCLLTFVLWVSIGRHDMSKITLIDIISAAVMGVFSWVFFIPSAIGLMVYWLSRLSDEDIVLWRRKDK